MQGVNVELELRVIPPQDGLTPSLSDYILVCDHVLDGNTCDAVIQEYAGSAEWQPTSVVGGYLPDKRRCDSILLTKQNVISSSSRRQVLASQVLGSINRAAKAYRACHNECCVSRVFGIELLRYRSGGFYVQHHDASFEQPRILTCVVGLNSDYEGGALTWFDARIRIRPEPGRIILFPSNFLYPHSAETITAGIRYVIVAWLV
jgi:predicted 2-oxoglutarate/Fe(II)-dependent dioxygenase YbiX